MTPPHRVDEETARRTREVASRAVRRLDIIEWVLLAGATGVAVVSGAIVAFLSEGLFGWAFRPTWLVASILLFVVPGSVALIRMRRDEREIRRRLAELEEEEHG